MPISDVYPCFCDIGKFIWVITPPKWAPDSRDCLIRHLQILKKAPTINKVYFNACSFVQNSGFVLATLLESAGSYKNALSQIAAD